MIALKFCAAALGLILPGYLLSRRLGLCRPWTTAFPFSALLLVEVVIGFSVAGLPVTHGAVSAALSVCAIACLLPGGRRRAPAPPPPAPATDASGTALLDAASLAVVAVVLAALAIATTAYPLRGLDTSFRWEGLARDLLTHKSLAFYPPRDGAHYSIYFYPDGIPPLVATVYWWIYACLGHPVAEATSISIVLQFAGTMALTFLAAREMFGPRAAWPALLVASTSPLLLNGFASGQETGFTALSVAGQICFAAAAKRDSGARTIVAVSLFAALGALARDYGPALALSGLALLAWNRETRGRLLLFLLATAALAAPWYLRSWALSGNPFYSHEIPGGFPVNAVYASMMRYYGEVFGFFRFDAAKWSRLALMLLSGGAAALCVGLPHAAARRRERMPLLATVLVVALLWVLSVGRTQGGVFYSTRVLTPAFVALAICAGDAIGGAWATRSRHGKPLRALAVGFLSACCAYALVSIVTYPFSARPFFPAYASHYPGSLQAKLLEILQDTGMPATGVLTDDPFLAEMMDRNTRFRPVPFWNPDVEFLFDPALEERDRHRRLAERDITLMVVDLESSNYPFLNEYYYSKNRSYWEDVFLRPNQVGIYSLLPFRAPRTD